jgi:hypothetical protein
VAQEPLGQTEVAGPGLARWGQKPRKNILNFYMDFGICQDFRNLYKEILWGIGHGKFSQNLLGFPRILEKCQHAMP